MVITILTTTGTNDIIKFFKGLALKKYKTTGAIAINNSASGFERKPITIKTDAANIQDTCPITILVSKHFTKAYTYNNPNMKLSIASLFLRLSTTSVCKG